MPTQQEIIDKLDATSTNLDDMSGLADQLIGAIVAGDAIAVQLRADIEALVSGNSALASKATAIFDKSEATENKMRAGVPGVPPVGGTPLLTGYASRAEFDAAVVAYTGPERVTVDGADVKTGTDPSLDYFSHSADGSVSTVGPTD